MSTTTTKSTHVMATPQDCERLRLLSRATRVTQAEYLREVARHVIDNYAAPDLPDNALAAFCFDAAKFRQESGPLASIVFRLPPEDIEALKALSDRTRVRRSEYLRVGLSAVLDKYSVLLDLAVAA